MRTKLVLLLTLMCSVLLAQVPNWAWAKAAGSASNWDFSGGLDIHTSTIATDKNGNSYITGHFTGSAAFGTITVSSPLYPAVFTAKYDSSGNCIWVKHFGAHVPPPPAPLQTANNGKSIDIDSLGNCYVTGTFNGSPTDTIFFGSSKLVGFDDTRSEIFLVKYDSNGNEIWAQQSKYAGGIGVNVSTSISTDMAGNSFMVFYLNKDNVASFGSLPPISGHGAHVVKFDASGTALWTRQLGIGAGTPNGVFGYAIENDNSGNCYVTGALSGSAVAATSPQTNLNSIGVLDTYVAKLNANGTFAWAKQFGTLLESSYGRGIGVDGGGNIFIAGDFTGKMVIGTTTLSVVNPSNTTAPNIFLSKLDNAGNVLWANSLSLENASVGALKVTPQGNCYLAGTNGSQGFFCTAGLAAAAALIVTKINGLGSCQWVQFATTAGGGPIPAGMSVDAREDIYLAGNIQGTTNFGNHTITSAGGYDIMLAKLTSPSGSTVVTTSAAEGEDSPVIRVFPNPFDSELIIEARGNNAASVSHAVLYDLLGKELLKVNRVEENKLVIKREGLAAGIYFFQVFADNILLAAGKTVAR